MTALQESFILTFWIWTVWIQLLENIHGIIHLEGREVGVHAKLASQQGKKHATTQWRGHSLFGEPAVHRFH
jgi:hypothetical protein